MATGQTREKELLQTDGRARLQGREGRAVGRCSHMLTNLILSAFTTRGINFCHVVNMRAMANQWLYELLLKSALEAKLFEGSLQVKLYTNGLSFNYEYKSFTCKKRLDAFNTNRILA